MHPARIRGASWRRDLPPYGECRAICKRHGAYAAGLRDVRVVSTAAGIPAVDGPRDVKTGLGGTEDAACRTG